MGASKRPNIIIFNPDQWRGDVMGHLGHPTAVTPTLDKLVSSDAVSFRNAFVQNPVCTPSRCTFMTGWYPHVRGHRTLGYMLQPDEPMLLKRLKDAGYFVWWGGKNDLVPAENGFDAYCDVKYDPPNTPERPMRPNLHGEDDWRGDPDSDTFYSFHRGRLEHTPNADYAYDHDWGMLEGAVEFLQNRSDDQPFCLYLPLHAPHPPYAVEDPWFSQIDRSAVPPPIAPPDDWSTKPSILKGIYDRQHLQDLDADAWQALRATYYGACARVDAQLGMLIDALQETGAYDDSAIFFFSDHGDFTGDYGLVEKTQNTFEDCLSNVPFVVKPPKSVACVPGVRDQLMESIDLVATVEALVKLDSYTHFGRSLLPVIAGDAVEHRDAVFCQGGRIYGETQAMELETGSAPHNLYWPRVSLQQTDDAPYHTKATMCRTDRYKYVHRLYEQDELYDLQADPEERDNRIDDPQLATILQKLRDRLMQFYLETSDYVPNKLNQREASH